MGQATETIMGREENRKNAEKRGKAGISAEFEITPFCLLGTGPHTTSYPSKNIDGSPWSRNRAPSIEEATRTSNPENERPERWRREK